MTETDKLELESYIKNKFVKQKANEDESGEDGVILCWKNWLSIYSPDEILNKCICRKLPVKFISPENITIEIYNSAAGEVPTVIFDDASDFENFIINLFYNGSRPDDISQMGASFIFGKTQRFLALSKKYYSNTPPEVVGLSPEEWREKSMILRREHECTHYYTRKFYGSATNNLHDELIADFAGIFEALGHYEARIFKYFMGIDGTHEGRLSLYTSGLSESVKEEIAKLAGKCADNLEMWSNTEKFRAMTKAERINYLCEKSIKDIAEFVI